MELRDAIDIFRKQARIFWMIVGVCIFLAFVWQRVQPESLEATLLLNISRSSIQNTPDYMYDGFYRLQADERFADTVVRWLGSPRIVEDIYGASRMDVSDMSARSLGHIFAAKRLSSQMIEVSFRHPDDKVLERMSRAIVSVLNTYTESLNKESKEASWFVVIGSDPVIRDARVTLPLALVIGFLSGLFIGFWTVLTRYYFDK